MSKTSVLDGATAEHWQMVEEHRYLVRFTIRKIGVPRDQREDAEQEGIFGLLRAVMTYDHERGAFSTWAVLMIRRYIAEGRERALGSGYRRHRRGADPTWSEPGSLDCSTGGGTTIADVIDGPHDPLDHALADETMRELVRACRDDFDRDIVRHMIETDGGRGGEAVARRYGFTEAAASIRRRRLRSVVSSRQVAA